MFIINKYSVATNNTAHTINGDGDAALYKGSAPHQDSGATGNPVDTTTVNIITATATYTEQVIGKLVSIAINNITANVSNYVKIDLSLLGIPDDNVVHGGIVLGLYHSAATTYEPTFIDTVGYVSVVNKQLVFHVATAQEAAFDNNNAAVPTRFANILVFYSTK